MSVEREAATFHAYQRLPSRESLAALLKLHQNRIYNICFQVLAHPEDAEDASQEVLIEAARCVSTLADARAFRVWLYRVALATSLNIRRSRARRAELARTAPIPSGAPAMDRVERDAFMQAISDLDEPTRSLLLEHYFEKTTLEELGRRDGVSAVAVWKRLEQAKERLRVALAGAGFSVVAAGVAHSLEMITPVAAPTLLITDAVLGSAAWTAVGGAVVGTKAALSGGVIVAVLAVAGVAGTGGYFVGRNQAARPANAQSRTEIRPTPTSDTAARGTGAGGIEAARTSPTPVDVKAEQKQQALNALRSMNGKWLRGAAVAAHLLTLDPDAVLEALIESWPTLAASDRILLMKAFEEEGHERLVDVLDLGMRDPDKSVLAAAAQYLRGIAFAEFAADGGYEAWRKTIAGKSLQEVRSECARQFVRRMEEMTPAEARTALRQMGAYFRPLPREALLQAGVLPLLERWLDTHPPENASDILRLMHTLPLDEAFLRRVVMPWMNRQTPDGNARATAFLLLGKPGNTWAIDVLLPYIETLDRNYSSFAAQALAEIGDYRVIPAMIDIINKDNTYDTVYGIGYFGLGKLTGVQYDASHDGRWWTEWWKNNQGRFTTK